MSSPPKPWERTGTQPSSSSPSSLPSTTTATAASSVPTSSSAPPFVPARPASLSNPSMTTSPYTTTTSPYNTLSPYSPYSRFGSTYSPYSSPLYGGGLGYGGMGGMGGYGYGGYGMNNMYGGMGMYPGMDPNNTSLTQTLEATTQHTFSLLHSIVQTFTGVAQMLESTFMATHSSFFAMVGVVEQFSHLRNALGSVLGLFGLVRWMKELITGKSSSSMKGEFREFINGRPVQGPLGPPAPKPSRKPIIFFFLAIIGIPYAMSKLIKILNERAQQQQPNQIGAQLSPLDPSTLSFARALYPFTPSSPSELGLKENEIVAIMGKLDPTTGVEVDPRLEVESEWWRGRTRDGREGWFPRKWVEILERRKPVEEPKEID
ncbi:Peroxin 13, N-terminal region-domain-containing protein [Lanmaoa asiatica]|nr:Peroxin 13, N-terminal region-domain-containing protein [Lanmaoa asiatica]